jgi:hypothetical protein
MLRQSEAATLVAITQVSFRFSLGKGSCVLRPKKVSGGGLFRRISKLSAITLRINRACFSSSSGFGRKNCNRVRMARSCPAGGSAIRSLSHRRPRQKPRPVIRDNVSDPRTFDRHRTVLPHCSALLSVSLFCSVTAGASECRLEPPSWSAICDRSHGAPSHRFECLLPTAAAEGT